MKFLLKYWAQITGVLTVLALLLGWLWEMKTRLDAYVNTQQQLVVWQQKAQNELDAHDDDVDQLDHRLIPLETKEDLRERNLMK